MVFKEPAKDHLRSGLPLELKKSDLTWVRQSAGDGMKAFAIAGVVGSWKPVALLDDCGRITGNSSLIL